MFVGKDLQLAHHLHARQANGTRDANGCLICTDLRPTCQCGPNEQCAIIGRDCNQCPVASCISSDAGSSSGGVSKGAVAAAVVVTVLVLAATVAGFFWYRRRQQRLAQARAPTPDSKPDVPARAEDVLNRPDPNEKPVSPPPQFNNIKLYPGPIQGTIDLDPQSRIGRQISNGSSVHSNPFGDNHSILTISTGTQSNVIPIALVPPGSVASGASRSAQSHATQAGVNGHPEINLDHVNISNDSLGPRGVGYASSARSGLDDVNRRASYMTTGSYTSDFLDTSVINTVKQVVGVARAEVFRTPSTENLSRSSTLSRAARSPLAATSFGPQDIVHESAGEQEVSVGANPFSDTNSPYTQGSPTPSSTTFGTPEPSYAGADSRGASWLQEDPGHLYGSKSNADRPASVYTQASAITADIGSARRVHLGYEHITQMPQTPLSAALSTPRTPYYGAKIVTPTIINHSAAIQTGASSAAGTLEQQQARSLKELHADSGKRISMSSVVTSDTHADSILESFPFVPPSPISNLPPRTPPRSPLAQSFSNAQEEANLSARDMVHRARVSASSSSTLSSLVPPNRKVLAMSVASQSSTVSNGLGSFPFQIESGPPADTDMLTAPSSFGSDSGSRKRASLDTLALTSDLSSYPLGFDKSPVPPMPRR